MSPSQGIPTIKTFPSQEILEARDKIVRNLKLKAYFNQDEEGDEEIFNKKTFQAPSSFQLRNNQLDKNVLDTISKINLSTNALLCSLPGNNNGSLILPGKSNLARDEITALRGLRDNNNIVIKSADRGGAIIVVDREAYILKRIDSLIILDTIRNCLHRFSLIILQSSMQFYNVFFVKT